jgi:Ca2+-binding EF-hand superfamily protein
MKNVNIYPVEKNLNLLFERFDKDEDGQCFYEDFVSAITPFMISN